VFLALYPAWKWLGPLYGHAVAETYVTVAPLVETPSRSVQAIRSEGRTRIDTKEGQGFDVTHKNLFIDLPLLIALVAALPGCAWSRRVRVLAWGAGVLALTHLIAFAAALHLAYAQYDLARFGDVPGPFTLYVVSTVRRLLYSDFALFLPFLICGLLALGTRPDRGPGRVPKR